jgi:hypothetical protein
LETAIVQVIISTAREQSIGAVAVKTLMLLHPSLLLMRLMLVLVVASPRSIVVLHLMQPIVLQGPRM